MHTQVVMAVAHPVVPELMEHRRIQFPALVLAAAARAAARAARSTTGGVAGGAGGNGGGAIQLNFSQAFSMAGTGIITMNGLAGAAGGNGDWGFDEGAQSLTIPILGTYTVNENKYGAGGGGGGAGGGAGGLVYLNATSCTATMSMASGSIIRANGGNGGAGGAGGTVTNAVLGGAGADEAGVAGQGGGAGGGGQINISYPSCAYTNSATMTNAAGNRGDAETGGTAAGAGTLITTPLYNLVAGVIASSNSQAICTGGSVNLTGNSPASGACPTYQWYYSTTSATGPWTIVAAVTGTTPTSQNLGSTGALNQTTYYQRQDVSGSCTVVSNVITVTVVAQPVAGSLTPAPAAGNICTGGFVSVVAGPGSGGAGTITDVVQFSIDGGPWTAYTAGAQIATTGHNTISIQTFRTATGSNCSPSSANVVTWNIAAQPVAGVLTPTPAAGTICTGGNVSAVLAAGSGGSGTVADVLQYSLDGGTLE